MTGKGVLTHSPSRKLKFLLLAHSVWLAAVLLLGAWWGSLVLSQARRIAELESRHGQGAELARAELARTERMVLWESSVFYALLVASMGFLLWIFWRDLRRTRSMQAFFASLTHELRTPLTSIRLQAESIADVLGADGPQGALVERLLADTNRLESQVEKTLELARVEGGGRLFTQPLRLRPMIERWQEYWLQMYLDRIELSARIEDLAVQADPVAVQVILKNLMENSVKHGRKAPSREKVRIEMSAVAAGDEVVLRYGDDGDGYAGDPRALGKIFQKGEGSQGAGVGLYLVRVLMERMGGSAEFGGGKGFAVTLRFPASKEQLIQEESNG